jgi:flagellar motor switch protein FliN/FliY
MAAVAEKKQKVQSAPAAEPAAQAAEGAKTSVSSVEFPQAPAGAGKDTGQKGSLDVLLDVNVPMNVVIGGAEVPVRRLLQLGPGSVITLDKSVDDPVELYLKGSKFATADIVVVEDKFAVRIKEILSVNNSAPKEDKK